MSLIKSHRNFNLFHENYFFDDLNLESVIFIPTARLDDDGDRIDGTSRIQRIFIQIMTYRTKN